MSQEPVMTEFDEIVRSDDDPVRHHTFYFDDGNIILNVPQLQLTHEWYWLFYVGTGRALQDTQVLPHKIFTCLRRPISDGVTCVPTGGIKWPITHHLTRRRSSRFLSSFPSLLPRVRGCPVSLLAVLSSHPCSDLGDAVCLNAKQWVSILVLADKYDMTLLRNIAVQKLRVANPKLNPVKQIAIARKYHCNELIEDPLQVLVARKAVLSLAEVAQLPQEDLHQYIVAREASQREASKREASKRETLYREALQREVSRRENAPPPSGQCRGCTNTFQFSLGLCPACTNCNSCGRPKRRYWVIVLSIFIAYVHFQLAWRSCGVLRLACYCESHNFWVLYKQPLVVLIPKISFVSCTLLRYRLQNYYYYYYYYYYFWNPILRAKN